MGLFCLRNPALGVKQNDIPFATVLCFKGPPQALEKCFLP